MPSKQSARHEREAKERALVRRIYEPAEDGVTTNGDTVHRWCHTVAVWRCLYSNFNSIMETATAIWHATCNQFLIASLASLS